MRRDAHLGRAIPPCLDHRRRTSGRLAPRACRRLHQARLRRLLNDPLFLETPKGVVPTARATGLAEPVADIRARVRSVISTAAPFDPASSTRRFMIGAPDGASAVFLPPLLATLGRIAPGIDIGVRPENGRRGQGRAFVGREALLSCSIVVPTRVPAGVWPGGSEAARAARPRNIGGDNGPMTKPGRHPIFCFNAMSNPPGSIRRCRIGRRMGVRRDPQQRRPSRFRNGPDTLRAAAAGFAPTIPTGFRPAPQWPDGKEQCRSS